MTLTSIFISGIIITIIFMAGIAITLSEFKGLEDQTTDRRRHINDDMNINE